MMNIPLTMRSIVERAYRFFPKKEIVTRTENGLFRYTYRDFYERVVRLGNALARLGIQKGDRVATFAWNHHRHLEAYFAIPCMGAVLHTVNIRLSPEHIVYILNHAEDQLLLLDEALIPIIEPLQEQFKTVKGYIIMTDKPELPATRLQPAYHYEQLLAEADATPRFPDDIDENDPMGMCYTSATTGMPKGVVYTHRGIYLHSLVIGLADTIGLSERDTIMPIVPMFHANAWGMPFAATMFGSKQVYPGVAPTPKDFVQLIQDEKMTISAGLPTIWIGVLQELEKGDYDVSHLKTVLCGGSAAPKSLIRTFEEKYGIVMLHAYGMTETSPLAVARLKSYQESLPLEERLNIRATQGLLVPGLELRVVGENGDVAWNGQEMGELYLRGNWIADAYYRDERTKETFVDGWLRTGDVATIDEEGFIRLVDRTKDLVKSGGEWISSVDLENALMAHPAVLEAAVIAVPHPKWHERPLACVVLKPGYEGKVGKDELLDFIRPQFAKWWIPDDLVFLPEIPKTSVGKFLKRGLREQFRDHYQSSS
nr:fatty-acid--CoA ligase [Bacillota bacterium]